MKKIKIGFLKKYNAIISILLSLLGFSTACEHGLDEYGAPAVEYGVPYATFIVKGNITSETTGNAIPNIRVVMNYDTAYTDADGNYQVENTEIPIDQTFPIVFDDIDGESNGTYQSLDTIVEFEDPEFTGGDDSWDSGETEIELNAKLKSEE